MNHSQSSGAIDFLRPGHISSVVQDSGSLFEIVINAFLLLLTDWLTDWLSIDGFLSALGASVILSVASALVGLVMAAILPGTRSD